MSLYKGDFVDVDDLKPELKSSYGDLGPVVVILGSLAAVLFFAASGPAGRSCYEAIVNSAVLQSIATVGHGLKGSGQRAHKYNFHSTPKFRV